MSLNRYEQLLYDYIESLPEERRYWLERVVEVAETNRRREAAALALNGELWDYFEERSRHEPEFADVVGAGAGKVSMLNLSEYLLRIWTAGKAKKRS